ncbi:DUF1266 domain-containing protein [Hymenobacter sp. HSC-4F20]|uniref:DUF1266 domain-containing protein n=1 Tax=Hymenobacter sp. HSC-4F20 TaxID=2864135 RepID=UPI001C739110|nr:DUF1266 domain-containing protein [Hymenobacter sp. HSC-4F20]MBX0288896.1 DUF1266 domain-containing protein [Hymenobacter sp. HSC-4F20]
MTEDQEENINDYGVPDPYDYKISGEQIELNPGPKRAIATGAILFYNGDQPMKRLVPIKKKRREESRRSLAQWWGIQTPADALQCLQDLHTTGHRAKLQPRLNSDPARWRPHFDESDFLRHRQVGSIAGWDYARIVNLAYWTRDVGLIDDDTAFHYFNVGAKLALREFNSWEELATSFLAGRVMWSPDDIEGHQILGGFAEYLLTAQNNVWVECPWHEYEEWWD